MEAVVSGRLPQVLTLSPATLTLVSEEEVAAGAVALSSPVLTSYLHPCTTAVLVPVLVSLEEVVVGKIALPFPALTSCSHPWVHIPLGEVAELHLECDWRWGVEVLSPLHLTLVSLVVCPW
jgi:hypothetical protein